MRAVNSTSSFESIDNISTAATRYIVVLETCKAIVSLTKGNPANHAKVSATGIADVMLSFINGGYGYIEDDAEKGERLRKTIMDTLMNIQQGLNTNTNTNES